jgi:arylsulfatase A-like enzyme
VPERRGATERTHGAERPSSATIDAALAWLAKRDSSRPFFLWVHLYDAHHPYTPSPEWARRYSTPYLAEVACQDHELGRLFDDLKKRGLWDGTFVLALADHGEAFGERGVYTRDVLLQTTLRVPLIALAGERGRAARRDALA